MATISRPEHPRPQFFRPAWLNLNGTWGFKVDVGESGLQQGWVQQPERIDEQIQVPFCPESRLSGVGNTDFMRVLWYNRSFIVPPDWQGRRVLLHFGAVDWAVRVWVNGIDVGAHQGGSSSFSLDITDALETGPAAENGLVLRVEDDIRSGVQPAGKQSLRYDSFAASYTRTSGIWQTVWLEAVPEAHIEAVQIIPDWPAGRFVVLPQFSALPEGCTLRCTVSSDGREVVCAETAAGAGVPMVISLTEPRCWSPEDPHLYQLHFELLHNRVLVDAVESYAGLRQFAIAGNRFFLNGKPLFLRLVLDQGFYPDGLWTAPSDAELRADIERSLTLGFNGARLHQKVFEERFHYWADQLGYLTWGEFPCWGLDGLNFFAPRENAELQQQGLDNHLREWAEVVVRDRNHPSIVLWTPLNEAVRRKGRERQYDAAVRKLYDLTRRLDPTRPVHDASGWTHVVTDVFSVHDYEQDPVRFASTYAQGPTDVGAVREQFGGEPGVDYAGQPFVVDEYGGTWWKDSAQADTSWGYGERPTSQAEALERILALTAVLLANPAVAGFCYTQLTDIEQEQNGLYTYDRVAKFPVEPLREAFSAPAAIESGEPHSEPNVL